MTHSRPPSTESDVGSQVVGAVTRYFFGTGVFVCLATALTYSLLPLQLAPGMRELLIVGSVLVAAVYGLSSVVLREASLAVASLVAGWSGLAMVFVVSVALGEGVHALALAYFSIIICVVCVTAGIRHGVLMALASAATVLALAWAEQAHWLRGAAAIPDGPLVLRVITQLLLVMCSISAGVLIARVYTHYRNATTEREKRFQALLSIAVDWYWEQDAQHRFSYFSDRPDGQPDPRRQAMIGHTPWDCDTLGQNVAAFDAHRADLEAHRPFNGLVLRLDGRDGVRSVSISGEPKFDARGVFCGYWGVSRDITAQVRAQQATAASEARYRGLFERSPSPLVLHRNGLVIDANDAAARMFGVADSEAMVGFNLPAASADAESATLMRQRIAWLATLPIGEGIPVAEFRMTARNGRPLTVQATGVRVEASGGPAILSIYFDITARVAAEAALRRSEAMLSLLFATSPDCITLTDLATGRYAMVNQAFGRLTGYSADEVRGRTAAELDIWVDLADRERLVQAVRAHGRVDEMPMVFRAKSGARVSMLLSAARFDMDGRDYLVINGRDVTETEQHRLEREAILDNASVGVAFTRDQAFVQANPALERMLGWQRGTLAGQPTRVVWASETEFAQVGEQVSAQLASGEPIEVVRELVRRDGSSFWCRMLAKAVDPTHPTKGGTIWIVEDITERRQIDHALASARDAAEAASRAKSAFLANTSHEIRTPLNGLLGLARMAMQDGLDGTQRQQYLHQIVDSAQSLASIITDILDLSKIEAGKITLEAVPFDLRDTLTALHHTYLALSEAKGLELVLRISGDLPAVVMADPVRVRQILSNFLTNALKFTEAGRVRLEACVSEQGRIRLVVADTGCGIDSATQQRLFTPFTQADDSTTRRFGGTGLGLSICRELAELMGGEVGVISQPAVGSLFWAELPLPTAAAGLSAEDTLADDLDALRGQRVLMVEDNPVNMMIGVALLEQWGVSVAQAVDGRLAIEAVEQATAQGRPFDVVLMDVQMPEMSGHEAARRLRERHSAQALPIIALTAAALVSEREQAISAGMNDFLTKPIDTRKLHEALVRYGARH